MRLRITVATVRNTNLQTGALRMPRITLSTPLNAHIFKADVGMTAERDVLNE